MRDFHLRFCLGVRDWPNDLFDLLEDDAADNLPDTGGAYVLGTAGMMLVYPWGHSPIFYIGKADNLRQRVSSHRKHILAAMEDHEEMYWWPRYQYGAAFGTFCAYYSRKGPENPQNIEATLIESFYDSFGSIPTANSAWPKKIEPRRN